MKENIKMDSIIITINRLKGDFKKDALHEQYVI